MEIKYLNVESFQNQYGVQVDNQIEKDIKNIHKSDINDIINMVDGYGCDERYYKIANKQIRESRVKLYRESVRCNIDFASDSINGLIEEIISRKDLEESNSLAIDIDLIDMDKLIEVYSYQLVYITLEEQIQRDFNDYCSEYNISWFWCPDNIHEDFYYTILEQDIYIHEVDKWYNDLIKSSPKLKDKITKEQLDKAREYIDNNYSDGETPKLSYYGLISVLFMEYSHITLGIESDGYIHS